MELVPSWMFVIGLCFSLVSGQNITCPVQCQCELQTVHPFNHYINCGSIIQQEDDVEATLSDILQSAEMIQDKNITLRLSDNGIASIPKAIFQRWDLKKIMDIQLNSNNLTKLTNGTFDGLEEVTSLSLQNNKISSIEKNTFHSLRQLYNLYLGNNLVGEISRDTFFGLENLQWLDLANNHLVSFPADTFSLLDSLHVLILRQNKMNFLLPNTFSSLGELHILYLEENKLAALPGNIFSSLDSLADVRLYNNQWRCNCSHLFAYREWMLSLPANKIQSYDLQCNAPPYEKLSEVDLKCVEAAPNISETTCKARIYLGETLELKCRATSFPDAKVSWNDSLTDDPDVDYDVSPLIGGEMATLKIVDFQARHEGLYTCQASNSAGEDIFNCRVSSIVQNTTTTVHSTSATTTVHSTTATTVPSSAIAVHSTSATTTVQSSATTTVQSSAITVPSSSATTTVLSNSTTNSYNNARETKGPSISNDQEIIIIGMVIGLSLLILIIPAAYYYYVKRKVRKENELKEKETLRKQSTPTMSTVEYNGRANSITIESPYLGYEFATFEKNPSYTVHQESFTTEVDIVNK